MSQGLFTREFPALEGQPPQPVVLLLHGRGADEEDLAPLAGELDPHWRYVSARAPFASGFGGYQWYESAGPGQPEARTFEESLRLAGELVGRLASEAPAVVLCGFSQGAVVALALLARNPQPVAAAAALSGYLAAGVDPQPAGGKPVFVGHGLFDPVIPVAFAHQARERLAAAGVDLTYREYPMAHSTSQAECADLRAWLAGRA